MSYANLRPQDRSGTIDRRRILRGLALLAAPALGASFLADATLAASRKRSKRSK